MSSPHCLRFFAVLTLSALAACQPVALEPESAHETETTTTIASAAPPPRVSRPVSPETGSPLDWNEKRALELVALPLSCVDRPHRSQAERSYLYETSEKLREDYEGSLAFYGCFDWHSAVNSTWAMVKVLRDFPDSAVASLIREKLENHLSKKSLEGELAFFRDVARPGFERPYGWAWLQKLYVELERFPGTDTDADRWAKNLRPLADLFTERTIEYLDHLSHPIRVGTHDNTAFALELMLEYARTVGDARLAEAIELRSTEFFAGDTACAVAFEPSGADFLSPCLSEAVLMSRVLDDANFPAWLARFLPDVEGLAEPIELEEHYLPEAIATSTVEDAEAQTPGVDSPEAATQETDAEALEDELRAQERRLAGAQSHLIGLAFVRSAALLRLASALPPDDPRARAFRDIAALQAEHGFETMYDAQYFGSHWLASFAVRMLTSSSESPR